MVNSCPRVPPPSVGGCRLAGCGVQVPFHGAAALPSYNEQTGKRLASLIFDQPFLVLYIPKDEKVLEGMPEVTKAGIAKCEKVLEGMPGVTKAGIPKGKKVA